MKAHSLSDSMVVQRRNPSLYHGLWSRGFFAAMRGQGKESLPFQRENSFHEIARGICLEGYAAAQSILSKNQKGRRHGDE